MELLKGTDYCKARKKQLAAAVSAMERKPLLAIVRIGERPDDISYEKGAKKRMEGVGILCRSCTFDADISNEDFCMAVRELNQDETVDGILLLRPFPAQIREKEVIGLLDPDKDVDGITAGNLAKVFMGAADGFAPCTAEAAVELAKYSGISLKGRQAVVVGRSLVVGKPLAMLLLGEHCTVTVCHSRTRNLQEVCRTAEILAVAAGKAEMIDETYISPGTLVLDIGIHVKEDGTLCGDVKADGLESIEGMRTPVPGGVGSVTTMILAEHVVRAAVKNGK